MAAEGALAQDCGGNLKEVTMPNPAVIGLDIAKNVFQVHGADADGRCVLRRRLRRAEVVMFFARLPKALVGIEACSGRASLGTGASQPWPRCPADPAAIRPSLRQDQQERRGRCGGNLRGGGSPLQVAGK